MAKYCNMCGFKLVELSKFCNQCGARVPDPIINDDNIVVNVNGDPGINIYANALRKYLRDLFKDEENLVIFGGDDYKDPCLSDKSEDTIIIISEEYSFTKRSECILQNSEGNKGSYFFNSKFYPLSISLDMKVLGNECQRFVDLLSEHFTSSKTTLIPIPEFQNMFYSYRLKTNYVEGNHFHFVFQDAVYPVLDINNENLDTDQRLVLSLLRQISYMYDVIDGLDRLARDLKDKYKYLLTGNNNLLNKEWLSRSDLNSISRLRNGIVSDRKLYFVEVEQCFCGSKYFPPMLNRINDHVPYDRVDNEVKQRREDAQSRLTQLFELLKIPKTWNYRFVSEYYRGYESAGPGYKGLSLPRSNDVIKKCIDHVMVHDDFESLSSYLKSVRNDVINDDKTKHSDEHSSGDPVINMYSNAVCEYLKKLFADDNSISVYGGDSFNECYKTVGYTKILVHEQYSYEYGMFYCELFDTDGNKLPYYFDLNMFPFRYSVRLQIDTKEEEKRRIRKILFDHFKSERVLKIPVIGLDDRYIMLKLDGLFIDNEGFYSFNAADVVYPVISLNKYRAEIDRKYQISLLKQVLYLYNFKKVNYKGSFKDAYQFVCTGNDSDNRVAKSNYRVQLIDLRNEISQNGDGCIPLISELSSNVLGNVPYAYPGIIDCFRNQVEYGTVSDDISKIIKNAKAKTKELLLILSIEYEFSSYRSSIWKLFLSTNKNNGDTALDPCSKQNIELYLRCMEEDSEMSISAAVNKTGAKLLDEYRQEYNSQVLARQEAEMAYYSEPTYDNHYESSDETGEGFLSGIAKVALGVTIGNKLSQPKKKPMMCDPTCPLYITRIGGGCRMAKNPNDCGNSMTRPY